MAAAVVTRAAARRSKTPTRRDAYPIGEAATPTPPPFDTKRYCARFFALCAALWFALLAADAVLAQFSTAAPLLQPLWRALEAVVPDVRQRAEMTTIGTPLTHARFNNRHMGTYGPAGATVEGDLKGFGNGGTQRWNVDRAHRSGYVRIVPVGSGRHEASFNQPPAPLRVDQWSEHSHADLPLPDTIIEKTGFLG
mgnify:CR=1 FL=1